MPWPRQPPCPRLLRAAACGLLGWAILAAQGPIRVGSRSATPPYEYLDAEGRLDGYCVDLLRACAARQGLALDFRAGPNPQLWAAMDRGELDMLSGAIYSEERARGVDFSVPLAYVPYVLLARRDAKGLRSEADLDGRELLVVARSAMEAYARSRGLRHRAVPDYDAAFRDLAEGRGDAVLAPKFTWLHLARSPGLEGLQAVPTELYPERVCFAVRKGRSDLLARLNEGLFQLKSSGELDALYDRHLGRLEDSQLPLRRAARRLAGFALPGLLLLGVALLAGWSFTLRRRVKRRTAELDAELARRIRLEGELEGTIHRLEGALQEVRQLSGLLPICANCKKIRDDGGGWQPLEAFISAKSEATFSHGICPECSQALYPDFHAGDAGGRGAAG